MLSHPHQHNNTTHGLSYCLLFFLLPPKITCLFVVLVFTATLTHFNKLKSRLIFCIFFCFKIFLIFLLCVNITWPSLKNKGGRCVCVFVFVSFHGENRVKRGKENVRSGCLFSTCTLSNVFECIFSQIWRRKKKLKSRSCCKFWAARQPLAFVRGGFEKNNFALFFLSRRRPAGRS